jgi:uncharacterized membrane protein (UPF0127 family)
VPSLAATYRQPAPALEVSTAKGTVALAREDDDAVVCDRCVIAHTTFARMRGLLGRRELPAGEGMLIRPAPSIQTFFMRFPIDVVFLSRRGDVLKVCEDVRPWRAAAARRAHSTLELAAGEARRRGIETGQRLIPHQLAHQE